jgi:hypothetical protein
MTTKPWRCTIVSDPPNLFVCINGKRIAQRGQPGSPQAKTWVAIEPGWTVLDEPGELVVWYDKPDTH